MLDEEDGDKVVLDVRNDYEWELGHFRGSEEPEVRQFRQFSDYAEKVAETYDKDKKIMMYCTGGIRNENIYDFNKIDYCLNCCYGAFF